MPGGIHVIDRIQDMRDFTSLPTPTVSGNPATKGYVDSAATTLPWVDVANFKTGGSGTMGSPWTGCDTAIVWAANTEYRFRPGYYAWETIPNFALNGLRLVGSAGVIIQHTGSGPVLNFDGGPYTNPFTIDLHVSDIAVLGNYAVGQGTITFTAGTATVTGIGTHFLTDFAVGNAISATYPTATESHLVTVITDDTHMTVDANWINSSSGQQFYTICKTTHGLYFSTCAGISVKNFAAHNVNLSALWMDGVVNAQVHQPRHSTNEPAAGGSSSGFYCKAQHGIVVSSAIGGSTTINIYMPGIDNCQSHGIWVKSGCNLVTLEGGASEVHAGPAYGVKVEGDQFTANNFDVEAVSSTVGYDYHLTGNEHSLNNCSGTGRTLIGASGSYSNIRGGQYNLLIDQGYSSSLLHVLANLGTGQITLSGSGELNMVGCTDNVTGRRQDVMPNGLVHGFMEDSAQPINAAKGNNFFISATGNLTIANPINLGKYQEINVCLYSAGAGNWTYTFGNLWTVVGSVALPTTSGATGTKRWIKAIYNWSLATLDVIVSV